MQKIFSLSWINTFVFLGAYIFYAGGMIFGDTKTNIASWLVFSVASGVNAFSYHIATGKNFEISRLGFASFAMATVIACVSFFTGQFSPLGVFEYMSLGFSAVAILSWYIVNKKQKKGAAIAQMINIVVVFIGFIPLWVAQKNGLTNESVAIWSIWTATILVQIYLVIRDWKGKWIEMMGPVTYLWFHIFVVLMILA